MESNILKMTIQTSENIMRVKSKIFQYERCINNKTFTKALTNRRKKSHMSF